MAKAARQSSPPSRSSRSTLRSVVLPDPFEQEVAACNGLTIERWWRLSESKRLRLVIDAASDVMGPRNLSTAQWERLSSKRKAALLREDHEAEPKTQTFLVTAQATVTVPADATVLYAANGQAVGFLLPNGREIHPALGFDDDGTCFITDAQMRRRGFGITQYSDLTGVEAEPDKAAA